MNSFRLLILLWLAAVSVSVGQPVLPEVKLPPQARELSMDEVQQLLAAQPDAGVLDVRAAEEVAQGGRLPGARHLDYFHEHFLEELKKTGLDPAKPCVVYCAIGGRSRRAAETLSRAGFKDIIILRDGFNAWRKAGKPVQQ